MKHTKKTTVICSLLLAVMIAMPGIASAASADVYLVREMTNDEVAYMQQALTSLGYLTSGVDGYFGSYTEQAVLAFQQDYGLYADGEAGPQTLSLLYSLVGISTDGTPSSTPSLSSSEYLKIGSTGQLVAQMQQMLLDLGYNAGFVDGYYGEYTASAVKAFQIANHLYVDGEAGPETLSVLLNAPVSQNEPTVTTGNVSNVYLSVGSSGPDVLATQQALANLGYDVGICDGSYGQYTKAAVSLFQRINHLYVDGEAGPETLSVLFNESIQPKSAAEAVNLSSGTISADSSTYEIMELQKELYKHRMISVVDGIYGEETAYAVKQIQKMFGLEVTGVADPLTQNYLCSYDDNVGNRSDVQGYYSATNWLIYVNVTTNRMYVYNGSIWNWNLVYNWPCSTGTSSTPTVLGEFTVNFRGYSFGDYDYTCYYFTSFYGPYYMHSTLYNPGSWSDLDARLGLNLSHGCVRLDVENAYWIYANIPTGTKVVVVR